MQIMEQSESGITPKVRRTIEQIVDERITGAWVTREDFYGLTRIVTELAQAQPRTELRLEELAQAQQRTDQHVQQLSDRLEQGLQDLGDKITALGSRWGIYNEATFRATIRGLLSRTQAVEVVEGEYGGRQVDVIIRNGEHVLLEITSRMHARDIEQLYRSADDYRLREGVEPALMVATSYVSPRLMEKLMSLERRIEIFSYEGEE